MMCSLKQIILKSISINKIKIELIIMNNRYVHYTYLQQTNHINLHKITLTYNKSSFKLENFPKPSIGISN